MTRTPAVGLPDFAFPGKLNDLPVVRQTVPRLRPNQLTVNPSHPRHHHNDRPTGLQTLSGTPVYHSQASSKPFNDIAVAQVDRQ